MADNSIVAIFGRKGSGKSELTKKIIKEHPRVFVIDSLAEYSKGFRVAEGKQACVDAMLSVKDSRAYRISLRVLDEEDNLALMELAYEFPRCMIVVEETSLYARPTYLPREIARLVRYGRHREIDQLYIARRPSEVHRDLTAQADVIVSFEQREPRDVKYLREIAGEEAERVRSLPKYKVMAFGQLDKMPLAVSAQLYAPQKKQIDMESLER